MNSMSFTGYVHAMNRAHMVVPVVHSAGLAVVRDTILAMEATPDALHDAISAFDPTFDVDDTLVAHLVATWQRLRSWASHPMNSNGVVDQTIMDRWFITEHLHQQLQRAGVPARNLSPVADLSSQWYALLPTSAWSTSMDKVDTAVSGTDTSTYLPTVVPATGGRR